MKHLKNKLLFAVMVLSCPFVGSLAVAQQPVAFAAQAEMSKGVIKKIDKDAGKLTIKHGELKNLDMPGMTMSFKVKDASMLGKFKEGDKVSFIAEKVAGALTVTAIEAAQ